MPYCQHRALSTLAAHEHCWRSAARLRTIEDDGDGGTSSVCTRLFNLTALSSQASGSRIGGPPSGLNEVLSLTSCNRRARPLPGYQVPRSATPLPQAGATALLTRSHSASLLHRLRNSVASTPAYPRWDRTPRPPPDCQPSSSTLTRWTRTVVTASGEKARRRTSRTSPPRAWDPRPQ